MREKSECAVVDEDWDTGNEVSKSSMLLHIERDPLPQGSDTFRRLLLMDFSGSDEEGDDDYLVSTTAKQNQSTDDLKHISTTISSKESTHKSILIRNGTSYIIGSEKLSVTPTSRRRVHWNDVTDIIS